jgi:hypothetical protein
MGLNDVSRRSGLGMFTFYFYFFQCIQLIDIFLMYLLLLTTKLNQLIFFLLFLVADTEFIIILYLNYNLLLSQLQLTMSKIYRTTSELQAIYHDYG